MGADTTAVKKKQIQCKSEGKNTDLWKAKEKAMDTNTGGSPGQGCQKLPKDPPV